MDKLPHVIDSPPIQQNFDQLRADRDALDSRATALEAERPNFAAALGADVTNAFANATFSKIPLDTIIHEFPTGMVDLANSQITIPAGAAGMWSFSASAITLAAPAIGNTWQVYIYVNGAAATGTSRVNSFIFANTSRFALQGTILLRVAAGDVITGRFSQNSGASQTADGVGGAGTASDAFCFVKGVRLSA